MEVSENFAFLKQEFPHAAESASFAERHIFGDPRASCFHARHALERLLKRVYKVEKALKPPKVTNLDGYISDPAFRELVPEVVWQKAEYIRQAGNVAVHGNKSPTPEKALDVVRELCHVLYWTGRTYLRKGAESLQGKTFDESIVPKVEPATTPASIQELEALKAQRDAAAETRKEIESELEAVRERLAAIKAENEGVPETHDWNEDKTRKLIIDLDLERAGWRLDREQDREYEVTGMPNESGVGYADYVLWGDDGKPLAVVEAKKTTVDPEVGQQQAKLYADCLEAMHGQRPVIFYTNGYKTRLYLGGAAVSFENQPRDGAGLVGARVGYGFNRIFTAYVAAYEADVDVREFDGFDKVTFGHVELGMRLHLLNKGRRWVPYGDVAATFWPVSDILKNGSRTTTDFTGRPPYSLGGGLALPD